MNSSDAKELLGQKLSQERFDYRLQVEKTAMILAMDAFGIDEKEWIEWFAWLFESLYNGGIDDPYIIHAHISREYYARKAQKSYAIHI